MKFKTRQFNDLFEPKTVQTMYRARQHALTANIQK